MEIPKKKKPVLLNYIIWGNDENISRMRISENYFVDGTFHHPPEFKQLIIIMYKDILTQIKIPGLYILINGKYEKFYEVVFESVINILTKMQYYELNIKTIVTDCESALVNAINKYFKKTQRISCFFHYKQDLIRNIRSYGLYKKEDKEISNIIINKLSIFPIIYEGKIKKLKIPLKIFLQIIRIIEILLKIIL